MFVFDVSDVRSVETGLILRNPKEWFISANATSSESHQWFLTHCGKYARPSEILKRWYRGDAGWSLCVYYHTGEKKYQVRVVIRDARAAMLFKLTWM